MALEASFDLLRLFSLLSKFIIIYKKKMNQITILKTLSQEWHKTPKIYLLQLPKSEQLWE